MKNLIELKTTKKEVSVSTLSAGTMVVWEDTLYIVPSNNVFPFVGAVSLSTGMCISKNALVSVLEQGVKVEITVGEGRK